MFTDFEKKQVFGFTWTTFDWPKIPAPELFFDRNLPQSVAATLRTLESIPVSDRAAENIILDGRSVGELYLSQLDKIRAYAVASSFILDAVRQSRELNLSSLYEIHRRVVAGTTIKAGKFRSSPVIIQGCSWVPTPYEKLLETWESGFQALSELPEREQGLVLWGFLARNQFFENGNKRTATLAASWLQMTTGYCPVSFWGGDEEIFRNALLRFYEEADLNPVVEWFYSQVCRIEKQYAIQKQQNQSLSR